MIIRNSQLGYVVFENLQIHCGYHPLARFRQHRQARRCKRPCCRSIPAITCPCTTVMVNRYRLRRARERDARQISGEPVAPEIAQLDGLESAAAEISLMLRIAPVTANSRLDGALALTARHPATLATGRITLCKARIIAEQTAQL